MWTATTIGTRAATSRTSSAPMTIEPTFRELGAAGVDDRDAWSTALDRLGDSLVPDRVAGEVEIVEDEAADRAEQLGDRSRAVASRRADDADAVPHPLVHDRLRVETELAERIFVLGLAEDRDLARDQLGAATVEMVAVAVRDDDGVEVAHDVL